jgi:hypothetical protein
MNVRFARPAVDQLTWQLYGRGLHPELFDVSSQVSLDRPHYLIDARICEAGHVIEIRQSESVITEICAEARPEWPKRGRSIHTPLRGARDIIARPYEMIEVRASAHVEVLEPEVFERVSAEFRQDRRRASLSVVFGSRNRLRPEPISLLFIECSPRAVNVHAFHTFPEEYAIVRTQSLCRFLST